MSSFSSPLAQHQACQTRFRATPSLAGLINQHFENLYELVKVGKEAASLSQGRAATRVFIAVGKNVLSVIKFSASTVTVGTSRIGELSTSEAIASLETRRRIDSAWLDAAVDCGTFAVEGITILLDPTKLTLLVAGAAAAASLTQCLRSADIVVHRDESWFLKSDGGRMTSKIIDGTGVASTLVSGGAAASRLVKSLRTARIAVGGDAMTRLARGGRVGVELANVTLAAVDIMDKGGSLLGRDLVNMLCGGPVTTKPPQTMALTEHQQHLIQELVTKRVALPRTSDLIRPLAESGPAFARAR